MNTLPSTIAPLRQQGRIHLWLAASIPICAILLVLYTRHLHNRVLRPFVEGILHDDISSVRAGLDKGADVYAGTKYGCSALVFAAEHDAVSAALSAVDTAKPIRLDIINLMLDHSGGKPAKSDEALTAWFLAAQYGRLDIIKRLVGQGIDINAHGKFTGFVNYQRDKGTALTYAARHGHVEIVRYLLDHGARVNEVGEFGRTALIEASLGGHADSIRTLAEHGANANFRDMRGRTALIGAFATKKKECVQMLVDQKPDLNSEDEERDTALMLAVLLGCPDLEKVLLDAGADVDHQNRIGQTALIRAILATGLGEVNPVQNQCVQLLLARKANVNLHTRQGDTALMTAADRLQPEMVQMLLANGANVTAKNVDGLTALGWAEGQLTHSQGKDDNLSRTGVALAPMQVKRHHETVFRLKAAGAT